MMSGNPAVLRRIVELKFKLRARHHVVDEQGLSVRVKEVGDR